MSKPHLLNRVLLAAAGTATLVTLGACSSEVKVERVVYDPPASVASSESTQTPLPSMLQSEPTQSVTLDSRNPLPHLSTLAQAREALEKIYDIDAELVASSIDEDPNKIHSLSMIADFDRQHAQTLKIIIDRFGWPTRELVGLKAVQGAYIAIQHAGHDPHFQSDCLALIKDQVNQGELPGAFLALMTDRVAISRGDPQIFGTQMTMAPDDAGVMQAVPSAIIWKQDQLDQRRAKLGMPAHSRFIEAIELAYFKSVDQADQRLSSVPTD
ncbi:MAG: DUF6624 domain-containing protein [Phycisphaerales bacterium]